MEFMNLTPQALGMGVIGVLLVFGMAFGKQWTAQAEQSTIYNQMVSRDFMKLQALEAKFDELQNMYTMMFSKNAQTESQLKVTTHDLEMSQKRVSELEKRVKELESENAALKTQVQALEAKLRG